MPEERVIFTSVIEGLYVHGLRGRVTPPLKVRLRALGLDLDQPLPTALPVVIWETCLAATAEELFPELPSDEAQRQLARVHVAGYADTLMGRAMFLLMRALGPRLALMQLTRTFRATDNYSETRLTELGPGRYELWTNAVMGITEYTGSLLAALVERCGARGVRATCIRQDASGTTHLIEWDA